MKRQRIITLVAVVPERWLEEIRRAAKELDIPLRGRWLGVLLIRLLANRAAAKAPRSRRKSGPDRRRLKRAWGVEAVTALAEPTEPHSEDHEAIAAGWQFHESGPRARLFDAIEARRAKG